MKHLSFLSTIIETFLCLILTNCSVRPSEYSERRHFVCVEPNHFKGRSFDISEGYHPVVLENDVNRNLVTAEESVR